MGSPLRPLLVAPGPPFLDWLARAERRLGRAPTAPRRSLYVVQGDVDLDVWIGDNWAAVFEAQLSGCLPDPTTWPQERDRALFVAWFVVELGP